jgi:beta-glucosidase
VSFPDHFLFGTATAAYQIEGAADEDGRGQSIWDTFASEPGRVKNGDTGAIACDHYHRLESDLDLLVELGIQAYRFSVAWPRIQPDGEGPANRKGLEFYRRLVTGLRDRHIVPMATLYHWDLPQALEDVGGWRNRTTAFRFAEYSKIVADELGDAVDFWVTVNEPWCCAFLGNLEGRFAPGRKNLDDALSSAHHLLLGHGLSCQALRTAGVKGDVGIALNLTNVVSATSDRDDLEAAIRIDGNENRWFLDPVFRGSYPADMLDWYKSRADLTPLLNEDMEIIQQPIDFLGLNFYEHNVVAADRSDPVHQARRLPPEAPATPFGMAVRPEAFRATINRVKADYSTLPIYITENGASYLDTVNSDGSVDDIERTEYLRKYIDALGQSIDDGVDVRGYFVWTLMDNFEWSLGYSCRFGIVYTDFETQSRTPKASGRWYQSLISAHLEGAAKALFDVH